MPLALAGTTGTTLAQVTPGSHPLPPRGADGIRRLLGRGRAHAPLLSRQQRRCLHLQLHLAAAAVLDNTKLPL